MTTIHTEIPIRGNFTFDTPIEKYEFTYHWGISPARKHDKVPLSQEELDQTYVFKLDHDCVASFLHTIARYAASKTDSFTWYDAAHLSQIIRRVREREEDLPKNFREFCEYLTRTENQIAESLNRTGLFYDPNLRNAVTDDIFSNRGFTESLEYLTEY
jgi:hypothetical protein